MRRQLDDARARLREVTLPDEMLDLIAGRIAGENVRSLRADLAVVREAARLRRWKARRLSMRLMSKPSCPWR